MRAQLKVIILVAAVVLVTLSAVLWKTQSLLLEDKMNFVNDSAMKQLAPLKRLITEKLENEKNDLVRFVSSREASSAGRVASFGAFDAVALMEPTGGQWSPAWIEKGAVGKWPEGYDLTLLKSLPFDRVKDGNSLWVRLSDPNGSPVFALLNSVEIQAPTVPQTAAALPGRVAVVPAAPGSSRRAVIVGFASENPMAGVTEDFVGSTNTVYLVDDRGYVASHTKASYLGTSFVEDPITRDITKTTKLSETKKTTDMEGSAVIGHFEKIDHTNLTAVILTPVSATTALASANFKTTLAVGGAVGVLALLAAWLIGGTLQSPQTMNAPGPRGSLVFSSEADDDIEGEPFQQFTGAIAAPVRAAINPPKELSREEMEAETNQHEDLLRTERKNAFEAFNASLAARLREPLLSILGHAQLAKSKSTDEAVTAHTESIEREARLAKDAIERFQVIEESASLGRVSEKSDPEKAVISALAEKAIEIEGSGIDLVQHITHVPRVKGRSTDIETLLIHLLDNAVESLRDRPNKKITVQLAWLKDRVRLLVSDTGVGMTRDVRARAFEPFYKNFESPRRMGLGLAFVSTTLKRIGASYDLESTPGEGTIFTVEFPVDADARKEFEAQNPPPDLKQINESIDAFTLGGRRPLEAAPLVENFKFAGAESAPIANADFDFVETPKRRPESPSELSLDGGFSVKIRRPKGPRG